MFFPSTVILPTLVTWSPSVLPTYKATSCRGKGINSETPYWDKPAAGRLFTQQNPALTPLIIINTTWHTFRLMLHFTSSVQTPKAMMFMRTLFGSVRNLEINAPVCSKRLFSRWNWSGLMWKEHYTEILVATNEMPIKYPQPENMKELVIRANRGEGKEMTQHYKHCRADISVTITKKNPCT